MKIAIITICTGKYTMFFQKFYESCKSNFLSNHERTFYVFTDGIITESEDIVRIEQKKLGWPFDTMMRFSMFNSMTDELQKNDYIFFFNVNMVFLKQVEESEVLPDETNDYLVGVHHLAFFNKPRYTFTYENNPISNFYIEPDAGKSYFQGCLNGGRSIEYLKMSRELEKLTYEDLKKNHIPLWHDESALNWYYSKINPKELHPHYSWHEPSGYEEGAKILLLDKNKMGGHQFLRS